MHSGRRRVVSLLAALAITIGAAVVVQAVVKPTTVASTVSPSRGTVDRTPSAEPTVDLGSIAAGRLDPATFPERRIERALLVVGGAAGSAGDDPTVVAVDAATGEWVRAVVPGLPPSVAPQLAPDGRSLAVLSAGPGSGLVVVRLSDGDARAVPITPQPDGECRTDGIAWNTDSRHVLVVSGCATFGRETMEVTDPHTWVVEIEVATGATRIVEHLLGGYPSEAYPTVSPDGRTLVYGVGMESDDASSLGSIRAVDLRTGAGRNWPDLHLTYGDPWRDDATVLAWDESDAGVDPYVLVDTRTGATAPLGIPSLFGVSGYVAGRLAIERTPWLDRDPPCAVAYCLADPDSLEITPWLELPGTGGLGTLSTARALLR